MEEAPKFVNIGQHVLGLMKHQRGCAEAHQRGACNCGLTALLSAFRKLGTNYLREMVDDLSDTTATP